jgi:N-acetylglutamate synthase-like GNAT family acetyltransferase
LIRIFPVEIDDDLEAIRELLVEYAASLGFALCFQNFEEELAGLPGEYAPPEGCLLLATHKGRVAACVAVRKLSDAVCEMRRLFIKPKYQRLGIGKALCEGVIEEARKTGYTQTCLCTALEPARALYKSIGFKEIGPYEHVPIESAVFMELKLI